MNRIDEIALKLAHRKCTIYDHNHHIKYSFAEHNLIDFAHALLADPELLAELSTDAEPTYYQWRMTSQAWSTKQIYTNEVFATTEDSEVRKLFTNPPNTAEIEQRTAEACAKLAERDYPTETTSVVSELIRSGKWREYL